LLQFVYSSCLFTDGYSRRRAFVRLDRLEGEAERKMPSPAKIAIEIPVRFRWEYGGLASVTMLAKPGHNLHSRLKLYWSVPKSMLWPLKKPTPVSLSPPNSSIACNLTKYFLVHGGFSTTAGKIAMLMPLT